MCNRGAMFIRTSFGLTQIRSNTPHSIKLNNNNQRTLAPFFKPLFVEPTGVVFVVYGTQSRKDIGHSLVTLRSLKTPDFE